MRARALHELYSTLRQLGYTTAVAKAAKACGGIVLCRNRAQAADIAQAHDVRVATVYEPDQLRGNHCVILPDNAVMMDVFGEIARLEDRVERDEARIFELGQLRVSLKLEVFYLERALQMLAMVREEAELQGAFRALAEIGLAVALGTLADHAAYTVGTLEIYAPGHITERAQLRAALEACGTPAPK